MSELTSVPRCAERRRGHTFADEVIRYLTGGRGLGLTSIAFTSDRTGHKEIWVMDWDGSAPRRLTGHKSTSIGLASYKSLKHHHNSHTMIHSRSFMDHKASKMHHSAWRMGEVLTQHVKVFQIETTYLASRAGARIREVPITFRERREGALAGFGFWVAGIDGAAFWGTIMAILSILPGIGAALVWVPAVIILFVNGQYLTALLLFAWCAAVVGTIDNVLRPALVGKDAKMSDLLIMVGTIGGLFLFGPIGFIVGPIVCGLFVTIWEIYGATFKDILPPVKSLRSETETKVERRPRFSEMGDD